MSNDANQTLKKRAFVMVTFGRGTAELKKQFDHMVESESHTNAGLALDLIREGITARLSGKRRTKRAS